MSALSDTVAGLKRPEYTGENRCLPCTVVNVAIAGVVGVALGVVWVPLGAAAFVASLLLVYFRGYLVPGTPTLTKRYLPERVLAWFGKAPAATDPEAVDVGARLLEAGVLTEGAADVELDPAVRGDWRDRIEAVRDDEVGPDAVAGLLDVADEDRVTVDTHHEAYVARVGGVQAGTWPSRAALVADVAGAPVLEGALSDWDRIGPVARGQLLGGLRLFIERCPTCDGRARMGTETVQSCCREREVVAVTCEDCGARLLETDAP